MPDNRIDPSLIARIQQRVAVDWRRTGEGDYQRMPKELRKQHPQFSGGGIMGMMLNAAFSHEPADVEPLKPLEPLGAKAVEKAEKSLGFKLPAQLRQLYLEVGDGGFGPFNGIRRLSNWVKDYLKLRSDLLAERGREWPPALLPIVYLNGKRICVDAETGAVVLWTKPPKKVSEKKWLASFVPQSPSVEAWLERWVDTPTVLEDGPDGGWSPPAEELERRQQAEAEREARRAAEEAKARTFTVTDLAPLGADLLDRVRARAMDPERRTYLAGAAAQSRPFGLDDIEDEMVRNADAIPGDAFAGLAGLMNGLRKLSSLSGGLPNLNMAMGPGGGMVMMGAGAGGKLGAPATEAALGHADRQLGFPLPEPLRQLYRIADGGFGPGNGLLSIARMIALYRKLTAKPQGPNGEPWPARLLPIWESGEEIGCLDLESGSVSSYDPSRMQDIHGGYFRRSFAREHGSLAEMIESWLGGTTFTQDMAPDSEMMRRYRETLPPEEDPAEIAVAHCAKMTAQERRDAGLPDVGWEDELRRRHRGY